MNGLHTFGSPGWPAGIRRRDAGMLELLCPPPNQTAKDLRAGLYGRVVSDGGGSRRVSPSERADRVPAGEGGGDSRRQGREAVAFPPLEP